MPSYCPVAWIYTVACLSNYHLWFLYIIEENVIAKIHNFNHESTYSKNNSKKTVFGLGTFDLG